jgi:hypothetical protein
MKPLLDWTNEELVLGLIAPIALEKPISEELFMTISNEILRRMYKGSVSHPKEDDPQKVSP